MRKGGKAAPKAGTAAGGLQAGQQPCQARPWLIVYAVQRMLRAERGREVDEDAPWALLKLGSLWGGGVFVTPVRQQAGSAHHTRTAGTSSPHAKRTKRDSKVQLVSLSTCRYKTRDQNNNNFGAFVVPMAWATWA